VGLVRSPEACGSQILQDEELPAALLRVAARVEPRQEGGDGGAQAHQLGRQFRVEPHLYLYTCSVK
jgi:hypothetical protein